MINRRSKGVEGPRGVFSCHGVGAGVKQADVGALSRGIKGKPEAGHAYYAAVCALYCIIHASIGPKCGKLLCSFAKLMRLCGFEVLQDTVRADLFFWIR